MTFQPVIAPILIALLALPVAAAAVFMLTRPARGMSPVTHRLLWSLRLLLVIACALLALRPGIPGGQSQTLANDADIVVVVDTTASIVAEDWDAPARPRLDGLRDDVAALVDEYAGARFALITFDATPVLRMPLSTDSSALLSALEVLQPEVTAQSRGSSIGIAAPLLADLLGDARAAQPERARMVFYFGDGEQTASSDPESFGGAGALITGGGVFGYGTAEGGPMRVTTGGVSGVPGGYIEYQGAQALSVIDEQNLRVIAEQLGVDYQHRTADTAPVFPPTPSTTTQYQESGVTGTITDLSWIVALAIVAVLAVELAHAAFLVTRMRGLAVRPVRSDPRTGEAR